MSASSKKQLRKEQNLAALTEKQLQEKKEARKLKIYTISFIVVIALIICIGAGMIIRNTVTNSGIMQGTTAVKIGEHKLTATELNYFYVDNIQEFYNTTYQQYGDMTDTALSILYQLNTQQPLSAQYYDTEGKVTWAEFFANRAVEDATAIYAIYDEAVSKGHTLSEEEKASMDSNLELSEAYATQIYGFSSIEDYLKAVYGAGSSMKTYRKYVELQTLVESYYSKYSSDLTYGDADYREYEGEHYDDFNSYSYSYFYVDPDDYLEGGTKGEDGKVTYTDEETAASVAAAKAVAEALVNSGAADVEALKEAIKANEKYADLKDEEVYSQEDVLYTAVQAFSNVTAEDIQKWLSAEGRKPGDLTVFEDKRTVKAEDGTETTTTYGFCVMLLEDVKDNTMELVNVRHILFKFQGGTQDENGETIYNEAEKKAALDKAEALLADFNKSKKTQDMFAELAKENSEDTGSKANGGLYEDVYPGQMVKNFNDWCFDESREPGNVEIVETEYGYHIIYFVGTTGETFRDYMIDNTLRNNDVSEWYEALVQTRTAEDVKIKYLNLNYIINPSAA